MIQILAGIATHSVALLLYPGLAAMIAFGILVELAWMRLSRRESEWPELPRRRPSPVLGTIALCALLASVQLAAPFNPVPGEERSIVLASVGLAFTVWAELALTVEFVAEPGLLLVIQLCWLLAVLGPAVQPESLRPQVLGNVLVPGLLPVKVACAFLYLLCLPALLRLWPLAPPTERRGRQRLDGRRILTWFPYCGLFTTLFVPPSADDAAGAVRFFALTFLVAAVVIVAGIVVQRRGAAVVRGTYVRAVTPFAALVLAIVVVTSIFMR
ncbi:MAG: hypothetical protein E6I35_03115 [Chloroflexi bacterium]|nr:MAG: hypothetical protein E6I41_03385 [Chloroflexota bacterium]TMF19682.1 MAG: hypothetical protein E6I35_03115 [Chloroflexota bacterium]